MRISIEEVEGGIDFAPIREVRKEIEQFVRDYFDDEKFASEKLRILSPFISDAALSEIRAKRARLEFEDAESEEAIARRRLKRKFKHVILGQEFGRESGERGA